MDVVDQIYTITDSFPQHELYGLSSQMCRCAISIPSNIAEGRRRNTRKDYTHFISMAYGSGAELETQIEISKRRKYVDDILYNKVDRLLLEVMKMFNKMLSTLRTNQ